MPALVQISLSTVQSTGQRVVLGRHTDGREVERGGGTRTGIWGGKHTHVIKQYRWCLLSCLAEVGQPRTPMYHRAPNANDLNSR